MARGLARIAAAHHPKPVIVRMSDFKTNEYANLIECRAIRRLREDMGFGNVVVIQRRAFERCVRHGINDLMQLTLGIDRDSSNWRSCSTSKMRP